MNLYSKAVTCHSAAVADANGTEVDCSGAPAVAFQIAGTVTTATIYFEGTVDGTNYVALRGANVATGAIATSATAAGIWLVDCAGLSHCRARLDWTAGSIDVTARVVAAAPAFGMAISTLAANSGVDIGDVTVNGITLPTAPIHGQKTVAAAGTEEALGASTALISGVRIKALAANTNNVYVGANPVTSATGFVLDAGEEVFVETDNLADIYIDVDTNGEGVSYIGG